MTLNPTIALRAYCPEDLPRIKERVALSWKDQGSAHLLEKRYGMLRGKPWGETVNNTFCIDPWVRVKIAAAQRLAR